MAPQLKGLSTQKAKQKLKKYGKNKIKEAKKIGPIKILLDQFISPLILLLVGVASLSFFVNYSRGEDYIESVLILLIVFIVVIAGFVQNYKAEKAIEALKKMSSPKAKVVRDGKEQEIEASEIVPDDIVLVGGGDIIPADAEIKIGHLEINESVLTGESKSMNRTEGDKVYSSCSVLSGHANLKVFATGMKTKVGRIAEKMESIEEGKTQFQERMNSFTNKLVFFAGIVVVITILAGFEKFGLLGVGLIAVSLAVSCIPEGLPAVITLALSLGAKRMVSKNALVRKLSINESTGSINIICTDKTGTLTEGVMKVKDIWSPEKKEKIKHLALQCAYYCNDAKKIFKDGKKTTVGDETDISLKQYSRSKIKEDEDRVGEISFTSERKMMSVLQKFKNKKMIFSKGAPEIIMEKCNYLASGNETKELDSSLKEKILNKNRDLASRGYRVLALACKESEELKEEDLTFISLIYLNDPIRKDVKKSVKECKRAGIRTIMITGDNPITAQSIAKEIGIKSDQSFTGEELDKMEGVELEDVLTENNNIFARTSPFHKLKILETLQNQKNVVAMTGDGVNDALALKRADVGVAMGIKGTEVSKQASDIILLDDNFATIRNSIKEGRRIFDNIQKFVNYLLSCNLAEVIVILFATLTLPFIALYPVQILWINLVTDGLVALALAVDPARPNIMDRKPRQKNKGIIDKKLGVLIVVNAVLMSVILLGIFFLVMEIGVPQDRARTILFTGFVLFEFVRLGVIKYNDKLKTFKEWVANKYLVYSLIGSLILQLLVIYTPASQYFRVVPLHPVDWAILLVFTIIGFFLGIKTTKLVNKWIR